MRIRPTLLPPVVIMAFALVLAGCAGSADPKGGVADRGTATASTEWPRTIKHEGGETIIASQPQKIVSTSLTATGTLLAIDAPVKATAATNPSDITDSHGFFSQWADEATERGVQVLYPNLEFDLESVIAAEPDLIVVSTSGADSTADHYEELSKIAPTIVVNYGDKTWQDLAVEIGGATGHEQEAKEVIATFDEHVKTATASMTVPEGDASIISFNGAGEDNGVGKRGGTHAKLLEELGFDITEAPEGMDTSASPRQDFAFVSLENLTKAATASTVFLLSADESKVKEFTSTPVLANLPSVKNDSVHAMGPTSFRLDYYSSTELVDRLAKIFA